MWKKLTALSLSLLICLSMLPSQAGAMDAAEDEPPVQTEDQALPGDDANAGISLCGAVVWGPGPNTGGCCPMPDYGPTGNKYAGGLTGDAVTGG